MFKLVKDFFNICLLRGGPEELPYSYVLLGVTIVVNVFLSVLIGSMIHNLKLAGLTSIAALFFSFVFVKLLLHKKPERFVQTFSAMLGVDAIISIISLPSVYSLAYLKPGETAIMFFNLTGFALLVWVVIVYGYIFSKALSSMMGYGVAISVGYALLTIMIIEFIVAGNTVT